MAAALAVFLLLAAARATGFWSHLAAHPGSLDLESLRLLALHGLLPSAAAAAVWAGLWPLLALPRPGRPVPRRWGPWAGAAAGLLAFAAFSALVRAAAPPTDWDARAYHLALPELGAGGARVPWMIHSHWPHLMEALYALPLSFGSESLAATLHLGAAAALVAATAAAAGGGAAAWCAALLLAGQPALLRLAGVAHSDAACALLVLAAACALTRNRLVLAGVLAGLAASCKMLALGAMAAWALDLLRRGKRRDALLFAAVSGAVVAPWLLRSWLQAGSPFWPFLSNALGDPAGGTLAARYLASNRWDLPPAWLATHDGPLFLLIPAAALFFLGRRAAPATPLESRLWVIAPAYALLTWRHHEAWRFFMPLYPALALFGARHAAAAFSKGGARRAVAALAVATAALPIALESPNNALFAAAGVRPSAETPHGRRALYEDRVLGITASYRRAREVLPPGAKVLLWRETRGYGAGFDYVWGDPMNQALLDYASLPGPDALAARLKELGVTHVLDHHASTLYREDPRYYDRRTLALMSSALARHSRPVFDDGRMALHALR